MKRNRRRFTDRELRDFYRGEYVRHYLGHEPRRIENILPYLKIERDHRVVDFGCGNGMLLHAIHEKVASYDGVDFSTEFIKVAREHAAAAGFDNATFHAASVPRYCTENPASFDRAFAFDFSEHVYDEEWLHFLKAIRYSLKAEALFYLHTPNGRYFLEILKRLGLIEGEKEHVAVRNVEDNIVLVRRAGFRVSAVHILPHYLPPMKYFHWLRHLPLLGRFCGARILLECRT